MTIDDEKIVAVGLLTETNVRMPGTSLKQVFPIPADNRFDELVRALDRACNDPR